ncbi:MAG: fumarylacetoacetate hydrolase family protein [Verrucomicrobia bacterium]|nr:fumarylacetoacetate hydrolase family protein [Verrucomicrobiota bacterium]
MNQPPHHLSEATIPRASVGIFALHLLIAGLLLTAAHAYTQPAAGGAPGREAKITKWARFRAGVTVAYGLVEGDRVRQVTGDPFGAWKPTRKTFALADVTLLVPTEPSKVLAAALNYKSHLGAVPERPLPKTPEFFFKPPSCLIAPGEPIVLPKDSEQVHFEGELVLVIGKRASKVPVEQALDYLLGVTCGNDVSARDWQKNDIQWWRAKGTDTFGPCGPFIVSGLNYDDLQLRLRVNGKVLQEERTSQMAQNVARLISHASHYVTLEPGDLIYTGTPGETSALKSGDVVEVEIEGVGVLRNPVVNAP